MENIINMIKDRYLIGCQSIKWLENGNILFIEDDGRQYEQSKKDFINNSIDLLTDLLNQNKRDNNFKNCIDILIDLKTLYEGLTILSILR